MNLHTSSLQGCLPYKRYRTVSYHRLLYDGFPIEDGFPSTLRRIRLTNLRHCQEAFIAQLRRKSCENTPLQMNLHTSSCVFTTKMSSLQAIQDNYSAMVFPIEDGFPSTLRRIRLTNLRYCQAAFIAQLRRVM